VLRVTGAVPLEDIRDVQAWVCTQVGRFTAKGNATTDEFDDLCGQGVVILYELHRKWKPESCKRFSAYALSLFNRRLIDFYRGELTKSGRGHVPQTKGGKRLPPVYHGMVSLDAGVEDGSAAIAFSQDRALVHYDAVSE
jgi:hypothetical protein